MHSLSPTFVQGKGIDTYGYFQDSANRIATQEYVYVGDCEELIYDVADGYRLSIAFYSAQAVSGFVSVRYWLTGKNRLTCEGDYIRITEAHLNDSPAMTLTDASNIKISKNYPLCETFKNVQSDISDFKTLYYKHNFEITAQSSNQFFQIDGKIGDTFKFTNNTSGNVSIYLINSSGVQTSVPSATPLSSNTSVSYTLVSDAVKMKIYAAQLGTLTVETTNSLFNRLVEEVEKPIYKTILQADMTDGICVQSNGQIVSNENYVSIKNVPVIPKQKVYMTAYFGGGANASGGLSGWDANGNFKKRVFDGEINGNPTTDRTQYINKEVIIPDGVFYLGFSSRKDGTSTLKLEIMSVKNTTDIVDGAVAKHDGLGPRNIDDGTVFEAEVKSSIEATQTVLASSGKPMLTMAVFTDLHHDPKYANDPTIDMMANIKAINDRLHFDAIMNLGDAIDGQYQTQYEAEGCLSEVVTDMYSISDRSHNLMGNHDDNVQSTWDSRGGEPASEQLTLLEINDALFKGSPNEVHNPNHITDYYMDYDEYNIRVICVGVNYTSYVSATQTWLTNVALQTDKNVLVYSHCATKPEWGYLNDISNGSYIETPLNNFIANGGTVIALIHGHTHGDMIETDASINFTEVAIGCAKFETPTSGTVGITYQPRDADDYTKILFDIVCVDQTNREVHFIRCGAGSDRYISY